MLFERDWLMTQAKMFLCVLVHDGKIDMKQQQQKNSYLADIVLKQTQRSVGSQACAILQVHGYECAHSTTDNKYDGMAVWHAYRASLSFLIAYASDPGQSVPQGTLTKPKAFALRHMVHVIITCPPYWRMSERWSVHTFLQATGSHGPACNYLLSEEKKIIWR